MNKKVHGVDGEYTLFMNDTDTVLYYTYTIQYVLFLKRYCVVPPAVAGDTVISQGRTNWARDLERLHLSFPLFFCPFFANFVIFKR